MSSELPSIQTSRLLLAPLRPEQATTLAHLADDPVIAAMTGMLPSPYTLAHATAFIAEGAEQFANHKALCLGVHLGTEELIGVVSMRLAMPHRSAWLGYWTGAPYRNKGYMREAAQGLLDHGFNVMNLNRIAGQCFSDNLASAKVLQACGLAYEGQMKEVFLKNGAFKDMLLFGLLRSQYESLEPRHD
ncbi:GNAT family protein [Pseudomonas viridiflava]|uniref:GNAT family N-acetyltransferase n=1 Tax=Pseudomonas viridiflava TaxID=33069 RepID=UPI002EBE4D70|nr:GNAT family protein [Pseudomonas viridiflava]